jgi:hypothetical protein
MRHRSARVVCVLAAAGCWLGGAGSAAALTPGLKCEQKVVRALRSCVKTVRRELGVCYDLTGAPCTGGDPKYVRALAKLQKKVVASCPDTTTLQAAGYGPALTPLGLVARLQEACVGEPAALAARSFGGPHAAALATGSITARACLQTAYDAGGSQIDLSLKALTGCVLRAHKGTGCDVAATLDAVAGSAAKTTAAIAGECGGTLDALVAVDPSTCIDRASAQAECLSATALTDGGPLTLQCGPRAAAAVPPRGVTTQVVLDEAEWGTRCGDGSPYAFQVRLAPAGQPVENVVVQLQGGGTCLLEADCAATSPSLFTATDDAMPAAGYLSNSAATNPVFADWTKVFLPYCTQDLHIGGGAVSNFPSITVNRFGAVNVRAALRYVRDAVWAEMNASEPEGYRPDRLRVVFGGTSAGGYGVSYNYHYVLDDLRWAHTTAVPDSSLGLDNGSVVGVQAIGILAVSSVPPTGWGALHDLPPYCFAADCAVVPTMHAAHAARLLATPEQQILNVSNQVDTVQQTTTIFPSLVSWIDAVRTSYCANRGVPGVHYFLSANPSAIHGTVTTGQFSSLTSAGVVLRDWLGAAATNPAAVTDAVSEGTLVATYGADPFACPVSP